MSIVYTSAESELIALGYPTYVGTVVELNLIVED